MKGSHKLDCIIIGYNEVPFQQYESFLRTYGEDSEAYRDLRFSFVDLGNKKLDYVGLMNHALEGAGVCKTRLNGNDEFKSGDIPNLAAAYLTNYLRKQGCEAQYINLYQCEKDKLADYLAEDPVCVAITTTFYVVNLPVNEMVEFIRSRNPKVKIVVGGPLISNHTRNHDPDGLATALSDIGADIYVIEGQGEHTLLEIIDCLKNDGDLGQVGNLVYFEDGKLRRTRIAPENNSLDQYHIDWRGFSDQPLGRTIQTRTARSCAFNCSFCNYPTRAGKLTLANLESIEAELDSMTELGQVRNVVFIDDTFNVPLPRFKEICKLMIKKDYGFSWFSYFRCSNADDEAFDLMAESGCKGVFLGIESGSPSILKHMNKAATVEKYVDGIRRLRERRILTFGSFIVGFPGETDSTVKETVDFIKHTQPDYYRAQMWYCEPGTPIDANRAKFNIDGEGFVWRHATMDSLEAMDHIDRLFLQIDKSLWLPQWSFDFWIIPYLIGRGISVDQFKDFMRIADKLLSLDIASLPGHHKTSLQTEYMASLFEKAKTWDVV